MTTDISTFAASEMMMRYQQPYVTEGLNQKLAAVQPRGVYRGFRLDPDAGLGDRTLQITADGSFGDHVAVYETTTDYSITLHRSVGDFLVTLTAYASQTVYITLFATYSLGSTTAAVMRVYTEAEYAVAVEKDELVVLGKVDVPAAGNPITSVMIHDHERTMAWQNIAPEALGWTQLLKNSGFEWSVIGATDRLAASGWDKGTQWVTSATGPLSGNACMTYVHPGGTVTSSVRQYCTTPSSPGTRFRARVYKQILATPTGGSLTLRAVFMTTVGGLSTVSIAVDTVVDASYETIDQIFEAPTNTVVLLYFEFALTTVTYAGTGTKIRLDDLSLWMETTLETLQAAHEVRGRLECSGLVLRDAVGAQGDLAALVEFDKDSPAVEGTIMVGRRDEVTGAAYGQPVLRTRGRAMLGESLIDSVAHAAQPRVYTEIASDTVSYYTLLWQAEDRAGADGMLRIYAASVDSSPERGGILITVNASWNQSGLEWGRDAGGNSCVLRLGKTSGFTYQIHEATDPTPWLDSAWTYSALDVAGPSDSVSSLPNSTLRIGANLLAIAAQAMIARLQVQRIDTAVVTMGRTLIMDLPAPTVAGTDCGFRIYRAYAASDEALEFVVNAVWNGGTQLWSKDNSPFQAVKLLISRFGAFLYYRSTSAAWADNAWESYLNLSLTDGIGLDDRGVTIANTTTLTNPAATTVPSMNKLYAKNIVKAWATVSYGNGTSAVVVDGFNLKVDTTAADGYYNIVAPPTNDGKVRLEFLVAMDDVNYAVDVTSGGNTADPIEHTPTVSNKAVGKFDVSIHAFGVFLDMKGVGTTNTFNVIVLGQCTT